jgi:signal transduction histidine kinase
VYLNSSEHFVFFCTADYANEEQQNTEEEEQVTIWSLPLSSGASFRGLAQVLSNLLRNSVKASKNMVSKLRSWFQWVPDVGFGVFKLI